MKALLLILACGVAVAQDADDYRGGWRTDEPTGDRNTYQFSIRGDVVRGVYCTRCSDATTLAFVDGKLGPAGLTFVVTHVKPDGRTDFEDRAVAKLEGGNLVVTGTKGGAGGGKFQWTMIKDARGPDPIPLPIIVLPGRRTVGPLTFAGRAGGGAGGGGAAPAGPAPAGYLQPAPWKQPLKDSDVVGVWLGFGVGINKQYFIIRKVGNKLRGMVCGRCDNPYTMAALDNFELSGDTLKFDIVHEDWGDYSIPFDKHVTARVAGNEMRFTTSQENIPVSNGKGKGGGAGGTSLTGPIAIEATRGNP